MKFRKLTSWLSSQTLSGYFYIDIYSQPQGVPVTGSEWHVSPQQEISVSCMQDLLKFPTPSPQKNLIPSIPTECLRAATLLGWRGESWKPGQEPGWQHWKNNICLHVSGSVLGMRGQGDFLSCNSKVANSSVASGRDTCSQSGHREQPPIMLLRTMDDDSRDSLKPKLSVKPRAGEEQWRFVTF